MNPNAQRAEQVFIRALDFQPIERAAFLAGACGSDAALRQRVEALLAAHEQASGFLPADGGGDTMLDPSRLNAPVHTADEREGSLIGRYKLLQKIGEGGCGVVYMAAQEEPVRRRVALKVIKLGMDTKSVVTRFEAERQALAMMDHPNIAKLLDAGATNTGRPYFVMELVRGVKITDYCDQHKLPPQERLELFVKVCQAIQHAHQKGIIHRDIKPSNILVTVNDGVAVPKVIDFGIAKATEGRLTDNTLFTAFEQFIGTPAYMSPEQAVLTSLDIDTRSDIYSLGVLLYELLTGKTPFDATDLMKAGLDEMRRTILEQEPPRPSTRLSTLLEAELATTAAKRQEDAPRLINLLRGDLDWIMMKCLEKDRQRRYETANGLAADIQRHLSNQPVVARPPSAAYRFQKMARRNKVEITVGAIVGIVLLLAAIVSSWQAARVKRAERVATEQAEIARSAEAFIAEQLPHLYQVRLGEEPRIALVTNGAPEAPSFWQRILAGDETVTDVPVEVWQTYLALNRTNAESLLAAQRVSEDPPDLRRQVLRQVAANFPNHPQVLFTTVTLELFPDERRLWIDRFKSAAPDNALPFYLSARAYLKEGDSSHAIEELQAAVQKVNLNDYGAERIQALEEIYLQQGRSPAEAKTVATCSLILPHLSLLKDLGSDLAVVQREYGEGGHNSSVEAIAQLGLQLGRQLSSGSGAGNLVSQKIGLAIERTVLEALDAKRSYDWLGGTPSERHAQIDRELSAIDQARERSDRWLSQAREADIVAYFDRVKLYGEPAAVRWLDQRSGESSPQP